jgi:class 3 adenylate cyclase
MGAPVGTIALLFSDVEGSTRLAAELGGAWPAVLAEHHALVGGAIAEEGGFVERTGQLELAADLLDEAVRVGQLGDSPHLWGRHSFDGDLAVLRGRPREALQHYAVALELAQDHKDEVQVYMDLCGLSEALVMNRNDVEALEVSGIAEAHAAYIGATPQSATFVDAALELQAQERVGAEVAADARNRGREVEAGYRVTRACGLARRAHRQTPSRIRLEPANEVTP